MSKAKGEHEDDTKRAGGGTHRERDPGRKTHDGDEGQPTDAVRSRPDPDGNRMADEKGVEGAANGTARQASAKGAVPREVQPNERAPAGTDLKRYKVRADSWMGAYQPTKYVLARSEDEARECYLKTTGLGDQHERQRKTYGPKADDMVAPPVLFVKELDD